MRWPLTWGPDWVTSGNRACGSNRSESGQAESSESTWDHPAPACFQACASSGGPLPGPWPWPLTHFLSIAPGPTCPGLTPGEVSRTARSEAPGDTGAHAEGRSPQATGTSNPTRACAQCLCSGRGLLPQRPGTRAGGGSMSGEGQGTPERHRGPERTAQSPAERGNRCTCAPVWVSSTSPRT